MHCQDSYLPAFLSLKNKKVLLVGGGSIALNKLEKLLDFTKNIKIIALGIETPMQEVIELHKLDFELRAYKKGDIKKFDIVIVAVDSLDIQRNIYKESRDFRIFVNSVDSVEYCDFIFGSYIKDGDLIISISTNGASPAVSKYLKIFLKKVIPKNLNQFIKQMKKIRQDLPKGKQRMKLLEKKTKEFFNLP